MIDCTRTHCSIVVLSWLFVAACSGSDPQAPTPIQGSTSTGIPTSTAGSVNSATAAGGSPSSAVTGGSATGGPLTGGTVTGSSITGAGNTTAGAVGAGGSGSTATSSVGSTGAGAGAASSTATAGSTGATATSGMTTAGAGGTGMVVEGDRSPEAVCARWNAARATMDEGTWSGNLQSCDAGDISAEGRENALRLFNLYRWLADLPAVETEAERNQQAQACALMMDANNSLSHEPPENWSCYTETGAQGARTSNISGGPGVMSVDLYMLDTGNESTMGHRRIILSNWLGPIGLGSTGEGGSSCMQNIGGNGDAGKDWVAWPPAGVFPIQAYAPGRSSYSDTGWSIQSEDIDLQGADVTVTAAGSQLDVDVSSLTGNYGSTNGIRIVPSGWDVQAGETYSVSVSSIDSPIDYQMQIVDCE